MNWYKKALLTNKNYTDEGKPINTHCVYCGRWATHPFIENPDQSEVAWKTPEEMDTFETEAMEKALVDKTWLSSGICHHCASIIKTIGYSNLPDADKIKEMSLGAV